MPIPENQLETWSHQGSIQQSSDTYNTIKNALEVAATPYASKDYQVFLQGSYGNDTNIRAESDVDIVIRLDSCFYSDTGELKPEELQAYRAWRVDAAYCWPEFKRDVAKVLTDRYGADVSVGDKAIAIASRGNRRKADVVVACEFRRYYGFQVSPGHYTSGICFWNKAGDRIANYPKQHSVNLTARHQATGGWLKPTIRVLKNLRNRLIESSGLKAGIAPSYYLEGLLYNVPKEKFGTSYEDCIVNAINWVQNEAKKVDLLCANEQYYLLRDNSHVCCKPADAETFLKATIQLWKTWP
jgi:hypothetical protein